MTCAINCQQAIVALSIGRKLRARIVAKEAPIRQGIVGTTGRTPVDRAEIKDQLMRLAAVVENAIDAGFHTAGWLVVETPEFWQQRFRCQVCGQDEWKEDRPLGSVVKSKSLPLPNAKTKSGSAKMGSSSTDRRSTARSGISGRPSKRMEDQTHRCVVLDHRRESTKDR